MDDVFAVLKSNTVLNTVICKFNNKHPNTRFTYECDTNNFNHFIILFILYFYSFYNFIYFMDVKVIRKFNCLKTCTYL